MQRRLAAILAADVVGYSKLMGADETGTLTALRHLRREVFAPIVSEHSGNLIKSMGDGWLVEFPSAGDAVACSINIQEAIRDHDIISLRIGLHVGDVTFEEEDIYGDGVNIAARLQEICNPGAILISDFARRSVDGKLAASFSDLGPQNLKNIAEEVQAFGWGMDQITNTGSSARLDLPDKPSIAILPFANMSGDPEQEFFADGMTEDIITGLSRFDSLFVTARNSVYAFKGQTPDVAEVGATLGVRYVLEGSIRTAGNRIRVTSQLADAQTGNHVWAERYDRELANIFDLQDEITETIIGAIDQEIGSIERLRAIQKHPNSLASWELLHRGLHGYWQMSADGLRTGIEFMKQCIDKDPTLPQAHSFLAFGLLHEVFLGTTADREATIAAAESHVLQAMKLNNREPLAHEVYARVLVLRGEFDGAIKEALRAVDMNPNSASAHLTHGVICFWSGRFSEGIPSVDRSIRLSPKDPRYFHQFVTKGSMLCETGLVEEGLDLLKQGASAPHEDYRMHMTLCRYAVEAGELEVAQAAADKLMALRPDFSLSSYNHEHGRTFCPEMREAYIHYLGQVDIPK